MKQYSVELLPEAWNELEVIADYHLMVVGPKSAKAVTDGILDSLERLKSFPEACPFVQEDELANEGYRMAIYKNYISFYRLIEDIVFVYHIINGRRDYSSFMKNYGKQSIT